MKEKPYIVFEFKVEGSKNEEVKVYTEDLRNMLKKAKLSKDSKEVNLDIETTTRKATLKMKLSELRRLIKKSELLEPIIPISLRKYLKDLTYVFSVKNCVKTKGRDIETQKVWFYLSQKTRNNVFLIGPSDVGKTTIALETVRQIATCECPREFYETRVLELKVEQLVNIKSNFLYIKVINAITNFLVKNKKNVILYVDKAINMKSEVNLALMLYAFISKYHIRILTTEYEDNFGKYFLQDTTISKCLNYIYVEEPELDEIKPMIELHVTRLKKQYKIRISNDMIDFAIYTSVLSNSTSSNPGKAVNVFERAFLEAKRNDKNEVDKVSILSCYDTYLKMYESLTTAEKQITAYHEAGHYIASIKSKYMKDVKIAFVSILPMMWYSGVNWLYEKASEETIPSSDYFMDNIVCDLAGRVGEMYVTQKFTSGARSDLKNTDSIAKAMIMRYGLSITGENNNRYFDNYIMLSEKRKCQIDDELQSIIDSAYERATQIIEENKELHHIIAERLLKDEILTGEQLEKICKDYEANR